jgi:hypothetical protein
MKEFSPSDTTILLPDSEPIMRAAFHELGKTISLPFDLRIRRRIPILHSRLTLSYLMARQLIMVSSISSWPRSKAGGGTP